MQAKVRGAFIVNNAANAFNAPEAHLSGAWIY